MVTVRRTLLIFVSLALFSSCAGNRGVSNSKKYQYEYVTMEMQVLEELNASPKAFSVEFSKDSEAWDRAVLFFEKYSTNFYRRGNTYLSGKLASGNICSVKRVETPKGCSYDVECKYQGSSPTDSTNLAPNNISRFIREGKLEALYL